MAEGAVPILNISPRIRPMEDLTACCCGRYRGLI